MTTPTIKNTPKSPQNANLPGTVKAPPSNPLFAADESSALRPKLNEGHGLSTTMSAGTPVSHPASFVQRVCIGYDTVPPDHVDHAPIVVPLGAGKWSHPEPHPFAVILALRHGERIAAKPRVCIYVSMVNGKIEFGDGVFAVRSKCSMIISATPFLELFNALRLDRRDFSALLNFKEPEEPHMRTKNWHERDTKLEVVGTQLGASAALRLFESWAKMDADGKELKERMSYVLTVPKDVREETPEFNSRVNRFTKFCHDIGLKMKNNYNFNMQLHGLRVCLAFALRVHDADAAAALGN